MRKVETTIELKSPPEKVIEAFLDYKMLKEWWGVERALIEKKQGGMYHLAWNVTAQGFGYISSGIIKTYDPKRILVIDKYTYFNPEYPLFGPMLLFVNTSKIGTGTMLTITQSAYQEGEHWEWYYHAVKEAWPQVASNLKDYLESS